MSRLYPFTAWLMGPTSSGKTTISERLIKICQKNKFSIIHYDGDEVRDLFGSNFGFDEKNRNMVIYTLVYMAKKANESGMPCIVSALTAHDSSRKYIRSKLKNLKTIYVKCPIDICAKRDPKGLYKRAKNKEINTLIGYNSDYLEPKEPDLILNTNKYSIEENSNQLLNFLKI